jgi:hypothetical protein
MENLTIYLNDHLAGSVAALELIDRLIEIYEKNPVGEFCKELRNDIAADQDQLKKLMDTLGEKKSDARQVVAWIAEKISRVKIQPGRSEKGELGLLQALEALFLGIAGKHALWRALATAAQTVAELRKPNYPELEQRAIAQCQRVEAKRLEIARDAFRRN